MGNVVSVTQLQRENTDQMFVTAGAGSNDKIIEDKTSHTTDTSGSQQDIANDEVSAKLDSGDTGLIAKQDVEAELTKLAREIEAQKQQEADNGGSGKYQMATGSTSNSDSTIDTLFDKKDINKDGVVSYVEELKYTISRPSE